jgi:poly-gamma-glutamate synthesis protein (capsule biosynthesis protein)
MIFVGDIAIPYEDAIDVSGFPNDLYNKNWFGNLEGSLLKEPKNIISGVYNSFDGLKKLTQKINFKGFALANNHIFDSGKINNTLDLLDQIGMPYCGAGVDVFAANKELVLYEDDIQIVIVNFGWEVIQCQIAGPSKAGVNPLVKKHVIQTVENLINKYPDGKIIPFMHWGYELEGEPQPFERELAKHLIDMGVSGVIGCHSHRIGGFEIYNNKPIIYSLGNWAFKQNYFYNGKHKFPDFCNQQLAFEWDFTKEGFILHFFEYDKELSKLNYVKFDNILNNEVSIYTPFKGLNSKEYNKWYKRNHFHKNKGLPIYYWNDTELLIFFKNTINKIRDKLIFTILKLK